MTGGTYTLIIKLSRSFKLEVGKLGAIDFKKGCYAYTGSALGKAGFKRITRYFDIAAGRNRKRHWHIDYFLPYSEIQIVFRLEDSRKMECKIAGEIGKNFQGVKGFGSSDCSCESHLHYSSNQESLEQFVAGRYINITSS